MNDLKQKWGHFVGLVLSPWSVIFVGATALSLVFSATFKDNVPLSNLLAIIGSITGGIAGGIFQHEYGKAHDQNILEKKGRSALRNLDAIREQITQIRGWIGSFKNVGVEGKKSLEETDRHLSTIMLNISAGLADWVDVVPELQERVEVAKKQEGVLKAYIEELLANKKELIISKDEKRALELKQKIIDLEKQIKDIRKRDSWPNGSVMATSGIGYGGGIPLGAYTLGGGVVQTCSRCGRVFVSNEVGLATPLCSECHSNGGVIANIPN